jgi:hypothetical protein
MLREAFDRPFLVSRLIVYALVPGAPIAVTLPDITVTGRDTGQHVAAFCGRGLR